MAHVLLGISTNFSVCFVFSSADCVGFGLTNCFRPLDIILVYICAFVLLLPSLLIEFYCSVFILRILLKSGPGDKVAQQRREGNQQKKRAATIVWIMLFMLVLNALPFIIVPLLGSLPFYYIALTFSTLGCSVQAFLFLSRFGKMPCKL